MESKWIFCRYDVWGNEDDGFEVNDITSRREFTLDEDLAHDGRAATEQLAYALGSRAPLGDLRDEWIDESRCELKESNGKPFGYFERIA